jgi:hypothetical protein
MISEMNREVWLVINQIDGDRSRSPHFESSLNLTIARLRTSVITLKPNLCEIQWILTVKIFGLQSKDGTSNPKITLKAIPIDIRQLPSKRVRHWCPNIRNTKMKHQLAKLFLSASISPFKVVIFRTNQSSLQINNLEIPATLHKTQSCVFFLRFNAKTPPLYEKTCTGCVQVQSRIKSKILWRKWNSSKHS